MSQDEGGVAGKKPRKKWGKKPKKISLEALGNDSGLESGEELSRPSRPEPEVQAKRGPRRNWERSSQTTSAKTFLSDELGVDSAVGESGYDSRPSSPDPEVQAKRGPRRNWERSSQTTSARQIMAEDDDSGVESDGERSRPESPELQEGRGGASDLPREGSQVIEVDGSRLRRQLPKVPGTKKPRRQLPKTPVSEASQGEVGINPSADEGSRSQRPEPVMPKRGSWQENNLEEQNEIIAKIAGAKTKRQLPEVPGDKKPKRQLPKTPTQALSSTIGAVTTSREQQEAEAKKAAVQDRKEAREKATQKRAEEARKKASSIGKKMRKESSAQQEAAANERAKELADKKARVAAARKARDKPKGKHAWR